MGRQLKHETVNTKKRHYDNEYQRIYEEQVGRKEFLTWQLCHFWSTVRECKTTFKEARLFLIKLLHGKHISPAAEVDLSEWYLYCPELKWGDPWMS